jgi:hypothetical protein
MPLPRRYLQLAQFLISAFDDAVAGKYAKFQLRVILPSLLAFGDEALLMEISRVAGLLNDPIDTDEDGQVDYGECVNTGKEDCDHDWGKDSLAGSLCDGLVEISCGMLSPFI